MTLYDFKGNKKNPSRRLGGGGVLFFCKAHKKQLVIPRSALCVTSSRDLIFAQRFIFCESEAMPAALKNEILGLADAQHCEKDDYNKKIPRGG